MKPLVGTIIFWNHTLQKYRIYLLSDPNFWYTFVNLRKLYMYVDKKIHIYIPIILIFKPLNYQYIYDGLTEKNRRFVLDQARIKTGLLNWLKTLSKRHMTVINRNLEKLWDSKFYRSSYSPDTTCHSCFKWSIITRCMLFQNTYFNICLIRFLCKCLYILSQFCT